MDKHLRFKHIYFLIAISSPNIECSPLLFLFYPTTAAASCPLIAKWLIWLSFSYNFSCTSSQTLVFSAGRVSVDDAVTLSDTVFCADFTWCQVCLWWLKGVWAASFCSCHSGIAVFMFTGSGLFTPHFPAQWLALTPQKLIVAPSYDLFKQLSYLSVFLPNLNLSKLILFTFFVGI